MKKKVLFLISLLSTLLMIGCAGSTVKPASTTQKIDITYSSIVYHDPDIWEVAGTPSSGTNLVLVNLIVENHGYDMFETNKAYFSVVVNSIVYNYDSSCFANDILPDTKVANGGTATGNVTFALPEPVGDITMQYTGPGHYNIEWINLQAHPPKASWYTKRLDLEDSLIFENDI